ncbi:MAG: DNA repair protein RecN [Pelagibacterales bacterium]|nr:DNA repair protein RecN [Pelagibacterales bacterium]
MLKFLAIQNIVLIDKAEIDFSKGLCILTGETGSGKSILLDALGLAIGFRSNLRLIGSNENKASVNALFDISNNQACKNLLKENELLDSENHNSLNIRRIINENSSSKVYINDVLIGVNLLNQIGETLVEIHGQHDQRGLLNSSFHIQILDEFSQNQNLLKEIKQNYENLRTVEQKISELKSQKEQAQREKDYLEHVVKELENANIQDNEEEDLMSKKEQLLGKEKISNFLSDLKSHLLEASSQLNLSQRILIRNNNVIDNFLSKNKEEFDKISEKIDSQITEIDASISNSENILREISNEESNLEEIEERLFYIRSLARKFNVRIDELNQVIFDSKNKLKSISSNEELTINLEREKDEIIKKYKILASDLSNKRKESAIILSKKVEDELKFLKMENTKFLVEVKDLEENQFSTNGTNKVKFIAAINNNNFDDISKIASGGELSRFMLALKVALTDVKSAPTIIFDEIDTGIGGSTANAVGKRLKILSNTFQILVVTHQPQIAAKADNHFKISKVSENNQAKTLIKKLENSDRENEVARMISGAEVTKEAIAAAISLMRE